MLVADPLDRMDGLRQAIEPDVRRLVATQLGVGPEELTPTVSLTDDLAADSLDVVELELALEEELGISLAQDALASVRTYAQLVDAVAAAPAAAAARPPAQPPVPARTRVCARGEGKGRIERSGPLTPYEVEILIEDLRRAGAGARLEIELPAGVDERQLAAAHARLAPLAARGVELSIRRGA